MRNNEEVEFCEVCKVHESTKLCDFASGNGIVTTVNFRELTETCDKKLCTDCAVNVWANCDLCPDHAKDVTIRLNNHFNTRLGQTNPLLNS